ncbi:VRR-NUC domain-containing protein [Ralstonia sp. UBA689]|uniref:VRR-NUC domain-containing protein n=1 Tax=Ralstonia sp. UBA689 TaxID=1947373 RepID=UPI0025DD6217|nr:VRR-NUC domain-containing protein [Ralstonia sp. UBA689]
MAEPVHRPIGNSRTLPQPRGKTIPVLPPDDTAYLCAHICACNRAPIISNKGHKLKQRCATMAIRLECDNAHQVWKYKGEVGYNMVNDPPSPIMAGLKRNTPLQFPLGVDTADLEKAFDLAKLTGRAQKGMLRIPDVVIVKNMHDFDLSQRNIEFVVEIKFPGDRWRSDQRRDYELIAGGKDRVKELSPTLCKCREGEPEKARAPATGKLPQKTVVPDMSEWMRRKRDNATAGGRQPASVASEPVPLADVLRTGAAAVGALAVAYVAVTIGGPVLLTLLAVGGVAELAAQ